VRDDTKQARICVPVCARRAEELPAAVARAAEWADLVELRLDCLDDARPGEVCDALGRLDDAGCRPLVFTYRPAEEGGRQALDPDRRAGFWAELFARRGAGSSGLRRPEFADIELSLFESGRGRDLSAAAGGFDVICSYHDFDGASGGLEDIYERMKRTPARLLKVAVMAEDATDCLPVLKLLERARREGRELIAVAMGGAGLLTRVLGPSRGSFLTYAASDEAAATAPGQVTARELVGLYRVREIGEATAITGLVGRPVSHSLSPHMHNAAFAVRGLDAVYIPFEVFDLESFVRRMARPRTREIEWRLRGFSVTAPHKQAVLPLLDWVEPKAREIGAVNTVVVEGGELRGYNTDAGAALLPLENLIGLRGARVAVIGAGGAARAVLWGLREKGARPSVFARDAAKARSLAGEFGAGAGQLAPAGFDGFDAVVNTTPLGTRGRLEAETPATREQLRGARVAYDLVYNPPETRFMREARAAECEVAGGLPMLVAQAAEQFRLWTGTEPPVGAMRAAAERQMLDVRC
jgi:3-dehydroquinate dehydratase / shikimate dehydrogenase